MKKFLLPALVLAGSLVKPTDAAILLNSPTTDWYAIQYLGASRTDFVNDQQTGDREGDLVGSAVGASPVQTAFYFDYDGSSDQIGFRIRTDRDSNPAGYKGAMWVGMMFDSNDSVDLFTGYISQSNTLGFYNPGTGANVSPSTTSIVNNAPLYSVGATSSNYLWTAVTVGPSGNDPVTGGTNDIGADGRTDFFTTWVLPFSQLQTAAASRGFTVTPTTPFRFVVGTSQQANSINQDLNGVDANVNSTSTFASLGATSPVVTSSGGIVPVPEPSTFAMLIAAMGGGLWFGVRRRS